MALRIKKKRFRLYIFMGLAFCLICFALVAPYLSPNDPLETHAQFVRMAPNAQFPWGTDSLGRCVMSRVFLGARVSILTALLLVTLSCLIGVSIGTLSGYFGGGVDTILMRVVDVLLAFPEMVLAIAVAGVLGGGLLNAIIATVATSWTGYARLSRSYTLALKNESFISVARLNGSKELSIIKKHILPNMLPKLVVYASMQLGVMMISIAGLSFLGLGITPPNTEWGSMLSEARTYIQLAPWASLAPALAIFVCVTIFNGLGEAIKDSYGEYHFRS